MATLNKKQPAIFTHEGGPAQHVSATDQLKRSVMACMLWENGFYESGEEIAKRISELIAKVPVEEVCRIAIDARTKQKLRHVPLLIAREMCRLPIHKAAVANLLPEIIQRPDELSEFMAIYWKDGKCPIAAQVKKGLAAAFHNFNEYALAKYNGRDKAVKLRDVLFMCHAKPRDVERLEISIKTRTYKDGNVKHLPRHDDNLFELLIEDKLQTPDTWETQLSAGANKQETWERLMNQGKLGALAFIRNLRNMIQANVNLALIKAYGKQVPLERVLPFRFIAAARIVPALEPMLEEMMLRCVALQEKLPGKTVICVDNSGSMYGDKVSAKSDMDRSDAACALAVLVREVCDDCTIIGFSMTSTIVPARRGFALVDAIKRTERAGTDIGSVVSRAKQMNPDRLIVITDEQSRTRVESPQCLGYMINVACDKNGVGYGSWLHIDGWSEAILDYIRSVEE